MTKVVGHIDIVSDCTSGAHFDAHLTAATGRLAELTTERKDEMEEPALYEVHHRHCGEYWIDRWSCPCSDKCPTCNSEIEPLYFLQLAEAA